VGQLGGLEVRQSPISVLRHNRLYAATLSINLVKNAPSALTFQNTLTDALTRQGLLDSRITMVSREGVFGASTLSGQVYTWEEAWTSSDSSECFC
jgi:hypothetical protein